MLDIKDEYTNKIYQLLNLMIYDNSDIAKCLKVNEKTLDTKKSENKNLNIKSEFIFKNIKMTNTKKSYQKIINN